MKRDVFCCQETVFANEWFRLAPHRATIVIFKKRPRDIQPQNYISDLYSNMRIIKIPKYISHEGKITTIKPIDHIVYTLFLVASLPYVLLHRAAVFITPPYFNTVIIPVLKLFRKKIYLIVLDPQTRLDMTYKERKNPVLLPYVKLARLLENIAVILSSKVFVISRFLENEYKKRNKNVFYTPNGADVKVISGVKKKRMFNDFTITYMGSFDPWRSVDLIVDAFKILQEKEKNVKLLLIGGGGNIEKIKESAKGNKDIVVTDWIRSNKDVIAYCKGSDALVMAPRGSEIAKTVSSIKCFEYIACEVPLLVTNTGEHAEWVRKLNAGIVVDADAASIARGLWRLINDKKMYKNLKENCAKNKHLVDFHETRKQFIEEIKADMER